MKYLTLLPILIVVPVIVNYLWNTTDWHTRDIRNFFRRQSWKSWETWRCIWLISILVTCILTTVNIASGTFYVWLIAIIVLEAAMIIGIIIRHRHKIAAYTMTRNAKATLLTILIVYGIPAIALMIIVYGSSIKQYNGLSLDFGDLLFIVGCMILAGWWRFVKPDK